MYRELVPWYRLLDPTEEHLDEATAFQAAFERAVTSPLQTLLELGAGAGNNAFHLKSRFQCTLIDLSEEMLGLSRDLNPECEHVVGDMRTVRLGRSFDAVLIHDAVMYMTSEADLAAAIETAFVHTRPGGATVIAPDCYSETFAEITDLRMRDEGSRGVRCLEWMRDPDPHDTTFQVDYAFMVREGHEIRVVHDRHFEGLFSQATWHHLLTSAGFVVETFPRPVVDEEYDEIFLCRRP